MKLQVEVQDMADFEVTMKKTSAKLQMLKIARNGCHQLLYQNKIKELETHLKTSEERLEELNNLKSKVQELMLEKDESIEHIEEWSSKYEAEVQENDAPTEEFENRIKELKER